MPSSSSSLYELDELDESSRQRFIGGLACGGCGLGCGLACALDRNASSRLGRGLARALDRNASRMDRCTAECSATSQALNSTPTLRVPISFYFDSYSYPGPSPTPTPTHTSSYSCSYSASYCYDNYYY